MTYLIGNWKSNENITQTKIWLENFKNEKLKFSPGLETIVCMPFTDLAEANRFVNALNLPLKIGAQDVSPFASGAHTGGITAAMLSELIRYCLVGHSERRKDAGETSETVALKAFELLEYAITPVICVDTPYLEEQIKALFQHQVPINKCLFAYEPLSAIGTNAPADPSSVEHTAAKINFLTDAACPVIYGGSVSEENILSFTSLPNISGVLVGSHSLDPHY